MPRLPVCCDLPTLARPDTRRERGVSAGLEPDPKVCCVAPALVPSSMLSGSCQDAGRPRRNDRGPQKGGDPTFINAVVNGEVAPMD